MYIFLCLVHLIDVVPCHFGSLVLHIRLTPFHLGCVPCNVGTLAQNNNKACVDEKA
jgi:hypothetical protein